MLLKILLPKYPKMNILKLIEYLKATLKILVQVYAVNF